MRGYHLLVAVMASLFLVGCEKTGSANIGASSDTGVDSTISEDVRRQMSLDKRKSSEVRVPAWAPFVSEVVSQMPPSLSLPTKENWAIMPYAALRIDGSGGVRVSSALMKRMVQRDSASCQLLREKPKLHPEVTPLLGDLNGEDKIRLENPATWSDREYACLREGLTLAVFTAASWGSTGWPDEISPLDTPKAAKFFIQSVGVNTKFAAVAIDDIQEIVAAESIDESSIGNVFSRALIEFSHGSEFTQAVEKAELFAKGVVQVAKGSTNDFPVQAQVSGQVVGLDSKGANLIAHGKPWFGAGVVAGGSWDITTTTGAGMTTTRATDASQRSNVGSKSTTDISTR